MEYERIHPKPSSQGGGISPSKLRFMLLGVEKKRKQKKEEEEGDEHESTSALRDNASDLCKDVDVVTSLPAECCSNSTAEMAAAAAGGLRPKDHVCLGNQRNVGRPQDEDGLETDGVAGAGVFEFQRAERAAAAHRSAVVPPFSKPAPSKWDDAQKWIASPTSTRHGKGGGQTRRAAILGYGSRRQAPKVVVEVCEEPDTKRIDQSQVQKEGGGLKGVSWAPDQFPVADSYSKPAIFVECSDADSAINRSQHGSSTTVQSDTAFVSPPSTVRSVSMRDMGTEMTPIASQEPSRTGTPVRATTPIWSPTSSRPSSPGRTAPSSTPVESADCQGEDNRRELTEKELKLKTRREIMALGTRLGKTNIAAWASKEEDKDVSATVKTVSMDPPERKVIEIRAAAWEEAEKAKYLARFKREEIKIQAWENHQIAKAEAEMRKIEVDVERRRACAHDRLISKLAAARRKAEERLAVAEAKRNRQATRAAQQADFIRRTGQVPSSFPCWGWCS